MDIRNNPIKTRFLGFKEYLSTMNNWVSNPDKATMAKPIETKKYKSSGDFKITSFTNSEDVKTIQALDTPKKDAITKEGKTLSSVNFRGTLSSLLIKDESTLLRR